MVFADLDAIDLGNPRRCLFFFSEFHKRMPLLLALSAYSISSRIYCSVGGSIKNTLWYNRFDHPCWGVAVVTHESIYVEMR